MEITVFSTPLFQLSPPTHTPANRLQLIGSWGTLSLGARLQTLQRGWCSSISGPEGLERRLRAGPPFPPPGNRRRPSPRQSPTGAPLAPPRAAPRSRIGFGGGPRGATGWASSGPCKGLREGQAPWASGSLGQPRVSPRRRRGGVCVARPARPTGCAACREPRFLLRGPEKTTGLRARACCPWGAGRMAEGRASGAAGLFAKQVQKKFSRAQEKVGSREPRPRLNGATRACRALWAGRLGRPQRYPIDLGKRERGLGFH